MTTEAPPIPSPPAVTPPAAAPAPDGEPAPRPWSLWSIASMVCATLLVPPMCLLAPLLGLAGLSEVRFKRYRGGRLAVGGIVLGFVATVGWAFVLVTVATGTRPLLLHGPVETLNAGLSGDVAGFRDGLWGPAAEAGDAEVADFLEQLRVRHGRVLSSRQAEDQGPSSEEPVEDGIARIRYEVQFERGAAHVEAEFVQHAPGRPLPWVLRWRSIRVIGTGGEDLRLPLAAPSN